MQDEDCRSHFLDGIERRRICRCRIDSNVAPLELVDAHNLRASDRFAISVVWTVVAQRFHIWIPSNPDRVVTAIDAFSDNQVAVVCQKIAAALVSEWDLSDSR